MEEKHLIELKKAFISDLEKFVDNNMSHLSSNEYFEDIEVDKKIYRPIHLAVECKKSYEDYSLTNTAECILAQRAIGKSCEYVTNLDYCQFNPQKAYLIITGTGWRKKE
jgi:hypothetical protein